jgi:hypothetical protein
VLSSKVIREAFLRIMHFPGFAHSGKHTSKLYKFRRGGIGVSDNVLGPCVNSKPEQQAGAGIRRIAISLNFLAFNFSLPEFNGQMEELDKAAEKWAAEENCSYEDAYATVKFSWQTRMTDAAMEVMNRKPKEQYQALEERPVASNPSLLAEVLAALEGGFQEHLSATPKGKKKADSNPNSVAHLSVLECMPLHTEEAKTKVAEAMPLYYSACIDKVAGIVEDLTKNISDSDSLAILNQVVKKLKYLEFGLVIDGYAPPANWAFPCPSQVAHVINIISLHSLALGLVSFLGLCVLKGPKN